MKTVIFCGGKGTRLNKTLKKKILKPLITINNKPLLNYIIEIYTKFGFKNFILLGGYKINKLKNFQNFYKKKINIKVVDTGLNTHTAGRLIKIKNLIKNEPFFLTYGDSIIDYNPNKSLKEWKKTKNLCISSYSYNFPYGALNINKKKELLNFTEKKDILINAGYYLLDDRIFKYIKRDESFEKKTLPRILNSKKIKFKIQKTHTWYPVDTIEDKNRLKKKLNEKKK